MVAMAEIIRVIRVNLDGGRLNMSWGSQPEAQCCVVMMFPCARGDAYVRLESRDHPTRSFGRISAYPGRLHAGIYPA